MENEIYEDSDCEDYKDSSTFQVRFWKGLKIAIAVAVIIWAFIFWLIFNI